VTVRPGAGGQQHLRAHRRRVHGQPQLGDHLETGVDQHPGQLLGAQFPHHGDAERPAALPRDHESRAAVEAGGGVADVSSAGSSAGGGGSSSITEASWAIATTNAASDGSPARIRTPQTVPTRQPASAWHDAPA
jgi:hypothetical protein